MKDVPILRCCQFSVVRSEPPAQRHACPVEVSALSASTPALPESRLYTLIDEPREFALYFLEGQRLIHDVALIHPIRGAGFAYFRDVILSVQPMIAFLKQDEQFGFYIDAERAGFRMKLETGHHGASRCMLLPEEFEQFPEALHGIVRVQKLSGVRAPYESVLEIEGLPLREIVNRVLDESYQVNAAAVVSQVGDQSLLLHQLPLLESQDDYEYSRDRLRSVRSELRDKIEGIFARCLVDAGEIASAFGEIGFRLLADRSVRFVCACSHARVIDNLQPIFARDPAELFDPAQQSLDVKCEYCKSSYRVSRDELSRASSPLH